MLTGIGMVKLCRKILRLLESGINFFRKEEVGKNYHRSNPRSSLGCFCDEKRYSLHLGQS